jgi:hypothetical protein
MFDALVDALSRGWRETKKDAAIEAISARYPGAAR